MDAVEQHRGGNMQAVPTTFYYQINPIPWSRTLKQWTDVWFNYRTIFHNQKKNWNLPTVPKQAKILTVRDGGTGNKTRKLLPQTERKKTVS